MACFLFPQRIPGPNSSKGLRYFTSAEDAAAEAAAQAAEAAQPPEPIEGAAAEAIPPGGAVVPAADHGQPLAANLPVETVVSKVEKWLLLDGPKDEEAWARFALELVDFGRAEQGACRESLRQGMP